MLSSPRLNSFPVFNLSHLRASSILQCDTIAQLGREKFFANRRNPTHRVMLESEFIYTDNRERLGFPGCITHCYCGAEGDAF